MRCKSSLFLAGIVFLTISFPVRAQERIYTIQTAGIQFVVPSGWSVFTTKDNDVIASAQRGAILMTFTPTENPEQVVAGMIQGIQYRFTDLQIDPPSESARVNSFNGIPAKRKQGGSGRLHGVRCSWTIWILNAKQSVVYFSFRSTDALDRIDRNADFGIRKFWDSVELTE